MSTHTENSATMTPRSEICDPESVRFECHPKPLWKVVATVAKVLECEPRRKVGQWDTRKRSSYVESIFTRMPLNPIYLHANMEVERIVDGLERLLAIRDYMAGRFALTGLRFCADLEGLRYQDLTPEFRRCLESADLPIASSPWVPTPDATLQVLCEWYCPERFPGAGN